MSAVNLSLFFLLCGLICAEAMPQIPRWTDHTNGRVGEPSFGLSGGGFGSDFARNYGPGMDFSFGSKVWESQDGRHSLGLGGSYRKNSGAHQGNLWSAPDRWNGGFGYRFTY